MGLKILIKSLTGTDIEKLAEIAEKQAKEPDKNSPETKEKTDRWKMEAESNNGFDEVEDALSRASNDNNRIHHIMQEHHAWGQVVSDPNNWNEIKQVIKTTLENGNEGTYRSVSNKTLAMGGKTIEVTFKRINNRIFISDAWVQTP